ncbi:MAG: caspase family protein [Syntrophaceae bacterium]|jgi:hypothetical protein|nr:caspase family protein [Syntrophaceae bacterium]
MKTLLMRILLVFVALALFNPSSLFATPERRIALVIGNSAYSSGPLKNPVNDATDMAAMLKKLGFSVMFKKNAKLQEMDELIREFGSQLKKTRGVGLFYYAGHGIQIGGVNYFLPVNARIEKESDIRFQSVNADMVLAEMENADNGLNIIILDACRDNPFARSVRNAARGLAIISNAPSGTFISYSTGGNQVARDGDGRNSPYTKALLENMDKPGLSISNMFMKVRGKVKKETGQIPWELSSLEGDFYFLPGSGKPSIDKTETGVAKTLPADEFDDENSKLEEEQRSLEEERAAFARKKALDEKRQKIAEEKERLEVEKEAARQAELKRQQAKKTLAMAPRPSVSTAQEIRRDGRFIAYSNGTVLDTSTNLMWAAKDNGTGINWANAKAYCENYRGGGYSDWRMPTQDELAGLSDGSKSYRATQRTYIVHLTELIQLSTCCPWALETRGSKAAHFHFIESVRDWSAMSDTYDNRALPVRSGK